MTQQLLCFDGAIDQFRPLAQRRGEGVVVGVSERPARARRYALAVRRGVVVSATQTSSGALARPDASRHLLALCRCVDALGRCGVDTGAARVHAWVDDAMSGTRDAPVAHLVAVEPLGPADDDDALAAALGAGPELVYRAVEAE